MTAASPINYEIISRSDEEGEEVTSVRRRVLENLLKTGTIPFGLIRDKDDDDNEL